ncbi:hypothetical protein GCM10010517_14840 [Streptosporangium fragile]|uniref:Uncharacterized protein n=1 Tax=Streptosporangium fragile TaxID=46186 RepID=A0ABN3VSC2_9ACTN
MIAGKNPPPSRGHIWTGLRASAIWSIGGVTGPIRDGRIHAIFGILNPDKLSSVDPASTA